MSGFDDPELSFMARVALQEFYAEQTQREEKYRCALEGDRVLLEDVQIEEDWQLSQFWYDDETAKYLSTEALRVAGPNGNIALVSCPTLYKTLKTINPTSNVTLFEFDKRFAIFGGDFIPYDYKSPLEVPRNFAGSFDIVIADPPFLSEECLTKTAVTIKFLAKEKILLCTGAKMEGLAKRLLGVNKCNFQPHHKNNLANEFWCYINYEVHEDIAA